MGQIRRKRKGSHAAGTATMKTDTPRIKRWPELIGLAAVVLSVLLLGLEIRQNTEVASAQAMAELNAAANDLLSAEAENESLAAILVRGDLDLASLSAVEARRYRSHVYALINTADAAHGFYQRGILDEDDFSGWRAFTCDYLAGASVNVVWNETRETSGVAFVRFVADACQL